MYLGMGADLQYQWYTYKDRIGEAATGFKDVQEMLALKFYLMFTLAGSGGIDAALQPYFVLPFDTYDLDPLSLYLNQEPGPARKEVDPVWIAVFCFTTGRSKGLDLFCNRLFNQHGLPLSSFHSIFTFHVFQTHIYLSTYR